MPFAPKCTVLPSMRTMYFFPALVDLRSSTIVLIYSKLKKEIVSSLNNMQQLRRQLIADVHSNILRLEKSQQRDMDTLSNLYRLSLAPDVLKTKKNELDNNIQKRSVDIDALKQKEKDIDDGKFDHTVQKAKPVVKKQVKRAKDNTTFTEESRQKVHQQSNRAMDNEDRRRKGDADYFYNQYINIVESLPEYMKHNLKEMPSNKGYIWRGCHFYGDIPVRNNNQTFVLFEKSRNNILYIHEIDPHEHRLFEKNGKEQRRLVSKTPRRNNKLRMI